MRRCETTYLGGLSSLEKRYLYGGGRLKPAVTESFFSQSLNQLVVFNNEDNR
jgi:hypothetical protein